MKNKISTLFSVALFFNLTVNASDNASDFKRQKKEFNDKEQQSCLVEKKQFDANPSNKPTNKDKGKIPLYKNKNSWSHR